jgi:pyroglutamyl-peptidase
VRVLLTGFQPFGKVEVNPSQLIVEHFQAEQRDNLIALVLPTEYRAAGEGIRKAIFDFQPAAVISLGVAQRRDTISLERAALNLDDASIADNEGVIAAGELIAEDGSAAYWSTLPLQAMYVALEAHNIPVSMSNHAGTYICNHAFYVARHTLECSGITIPCGFIHIPDIAKPDDPNSKGLPLELMITAVEICIGVVQETLKVES